ncbi:MAG: flagellar biosynthesis protein FlgJ [Rhodobacteraceae bacterium]|jgi:flagellar protein FlgJ|uniref:Rod binding protein n=1 Tax=Salipiger profundus TaxID=1229727 RepID=A0A1U7D3C4_9RHOB|nr:MULTISPECIES: rod-binding protein [Salipiger]APX22651.1 Rod binding protein [Salipiger profundus]MAB05941.1 flagellar biosynthesis protein FlgJ [Paracoccaceae bacterium]GGA10619.1 chemotaxis protein CheL [Salipiger profundus]SFC65852.1 Rod binding protein [Salipiger profundus]|tara:strand:- start:168 stop:428 length:261 start_codon:yes stop_codon:yes gene_type:complete
MKIAATPPPGHTSPLQKAAIQLEAAFLAELLKSAGVGESRDSFGGGIGEDQFASFLRQQHAGSLAQAGGIGLAESIFNALKERPDG